jgi:hypothetical protein
MANWDRTCTNCGFLGSYLDFKSPEGEDGADPEDQTCDRDEGCGKTVSWETACRFCGAELDDDGWCPEGCDDEDDDEEEEEEEAEE